MPKKKKKPNKILYWIPRVIMILYLALLLLLSFDKTGETFWENILGILIQLILPAVFLVFLLYTWKKPLWGGIALIVLGIITFFAFGTYKEIITFLTITLPVLFSGILFVIEGKKK